MTGTKPQIVLSNEEVSELLELDPDFRQSIVEGFEKVFEKAVENAKREAGTEPHQSG